MHLSVCLSSLKQRRERRRLLRDTSHVPAPDDDFDPHYSLSGHHAPMARAPAPSRGVRNWVGRVNGPDSGAPAPVHACPPAELPSCPRCLQHEIPRARPASWHRLYQSCQSAFRNKLCKGHREPGSPPLSSWEATSGASATQCWRFLRGAGGPASRAGLPRIPPMALPG